jgi:putative transposase
MIKSIKIRLEPNNKQNTKLFKFASTSRFIYNWTLDKQQKNYKAGNKFISDCELRKELTILKKTDEMAWLKEISCDIPKQAVKDACNAYKRFFKGLCKYPKFKSKKKSKPSFYQDTAKIQIFKNHIHLSNIGKIKISESNRLPIGNSIKKEILVSNPRITFNGLHWYISLGVEFDDHLEVNINGDTLGIDVGIKNLAILSNGIVIKNINKSNKVKKIIKRKLKLQKKIAKKYIKNKKGVCYVKTANIVKLEIKVKKLSKKITNIKLDHLHKATTMIMKTKFSKIVVESLNISGMMKNHKLAKALQEQSLSEFKRQLEYKCKWNNIEFIQADRWFPSSKTCSKCGYKKPKLSLSERIFKCESCGFELDRDLNAAINLKNYTVS